MQIIFSKINEKNINILTDESGIVQTQLYSSLIIIYLKYNAAQSDLVQNASYDISAFSRRYFVQLFYYLFSVLIKDISRIFSQSTASESIRKSFRVLDDRVVPQKSLLQIDVGFLVSFLIATFFSVWSLT